MTKVDFSYYKELHTKAHTRAEEIAAEVYKVENLVSYLPSIERYIQELTQTLYEIEKAAAEPSHDD
jgi:hypothetical protein